MGCGMKCIKYLMIVFNLLFFICGVVLLGLGSWAAVNGPELVENSLGMLVDGLNLEDTPLAIDGLLVAAYILIAAGCLIVVVSFFGLVGAIMENRCLLGTFFALVLIIFIIEIVGAILAFVYSPQIDGIILETMRMYEPDNTNSTITQTWDFIQNRFQCCGFNSSQNWVDNGPYPIGGTLVPPSCCDLTDRSRIPECVTTRMGTIFTATCENRILNMAAPDIQLFVGVIGGIGIGILAVEILAMIFACCLFTHVGKEV